MITQKKLIIFFLFSTVLLLLRDTPYLNVLIIERLWIIYLILLIWIISHFFPRRSGIFFLGVFSLLFVSLMFSFTSIAIVPEVIGIIIYVLLWLIVLQKIVTLYLTRKKDR